MLVGRRSSRGACRSGLTPTLRAPRAVSSSRVPSVTEPFTPYQKRLFAFLSVATFFEGYDFMALTQILPELRKSFSLDETAGGILVSFINIGTVLAYFLVRRADRWGRKRVLTLTILGYTTFTFLCGISPNVWAFAACQM